MKIRLNDIAREHGVEPDELKKLVNEKLPEEYVSGRKQGGYWIDPDGLPIIRKALEMRELVPKHYKARVGKQCAHARCVMAKIKELKGVIVYVWLPPGIFYRNVQNRFILVEDIKDKTGRVFKMVGFAKGAGWREPALRFKQPALPTESTRPPEE